MKDRTVLVTGSTDGIGKATALKLAAMDAVVLLHGRNPELGHAVEKEIRRKTGNERIELFIADLSSMRQVRDLAAEIRENHDRLHVLINNAGTFMAERELTEDGFETTFAVNYLAPFLLTHELLDLLKRSVPSRIINIASMTHLNGSLDPDNLQGERYYDGFQAYANSKLAVILFTYALAERLQGTKVTANCLHPGVIRTKLLRAGFGDHSGDTPERGAVTSVYLASSPEVEDVTGQYFVDSRQARSSPSSRDRRLQETLWQISERLTGLI